MIDTLIDGQSLAAIDVYTSKHPAIPSATRDVTYTSVPGRLHGSLTRKLGWKDATLTVPLTYYDLKNIQTKKRQLVGIVQNATKLAFSDDPGCYFLIKNADMSELTLDDDTETVATASISATIDPYQYQETTAAAYTKDAVMNNLGNQPAEPLITIYGSGHCELVVGDTRFGVDDVDGSVVVDSRLQVVHDGDTNMDSKMSGDFPTIAVGQSTIQFGEGVTKIEIDPRWCWTL